MNESESLNMKSPAFPEPADHAAASTASAPIESKPRIARWVVVLKNEVGAFRVGTCIHLRVLVDGLRSLHAEASAAGGNDATRPSLGSAEAAVMAAAGSNVRPTRLPGPWTVAWAEGHASDEAAFDRERAIKSRKSAQWICVNLLNGGATCGVVLPPPDME